MDEINRELLDALKGLLAATEPAAGDGLGCCAEGAPCAWHHAYGLVNRITGDTYGDWYARLTDTMERIEWVKLSNAAIDNVLGKGEYRVMAAMWEDTAIEEYEETRLACQQIEMARPSMNVWVETGDYIYCKGWKGDVRVDTYDAWYRLIRIPAGIWARKREALIEADRAWRTAAHQKIVGTVVDARVNQLPYEFGVKKPEEQNA